MNHRQLLLALLLLTACTLASARTIEMKVNGLVCAFCAQGIEKTLKALPATDQVYVSLENRIVAVHLKDGSDIDDATLRKAITNAGYSVVGIQRTDTPLDVIRQRARHD
ncbi:MAG: copper chaperone [Xanthomonadaceae bacterium]|nr:copper chaperone [Xanthomonadaceae bacterium]